MDLRKDVYFYNDFASFPVTGVEGRLYVDKALGTIYTWNGFSYSSSGGASSGLNFLGAWDASSNIPTIVSGVGTVGDYYIVGEAGSTTIDGINDWSVSDWIIFSSTGSWQKIDNSDSPAINIYNSDGTLTGNRKVNTSSEDLTIGVEYTDGVPSGSLGIITNILQDLSQYGKTKTELKENEYKISVESPITESSILVNGNGVYGSASLNGNISGITLEPGISNITTLDPLSNNNTIISTTSAEANILNTNNSFNTQTSYLQGTSIELSSSSTSSSESGVLNVSTSAIGSTVKLDNLGNQTQFEQNQTGFQFTTTDSSLNSIQQTNNTLNITNSVSDAAGIISTYYQEKNIIQLDVSDNVSSKTIAITPSSISINNAYDLPSSDGSIGQVLTTNGAGILSFTTPSSGTVTSVGLTTGTSGTDINVSGSPVTGSGSLNINIPIASATNTGKLSSTDWSVFNGKQDVLVSGSNIKTIEGQSLIGSGNIDITKSDVGLSNVDNTSDLNKPISTATQTALNLKQNTITLTTTGTSGAATLIGSTLNIPQYSGTNIYNSDGSLSGNRVVTMGTNTINFSGGNFGINSSSFDALNPERLLVAPSNQINAVVAKGSVNNYMQFNIQNTSNGTNSSSDVVATANNGTELINYIDMGINGGNNGGGFIGVANDAYLYSAGRELLIGNTNITNTGNIKFFAGNATGSSIGMTLNYQNRLGIGTTTPAELLDVNGKAKVSQIQVTTGAANGYVLTSDASGNASWQASSSSLIAAAPYEFFRGFNFANNSTTVTTLGGLTAGSTASVTAQSVSSTSFASRQIRLRYAPTVVATGQYCGLRGSALLWYLTGGFRYICEFSVSDTSFGSTCQQFYGLGGQTTDLAYGGVGSTAVSSLLNIIGIGSESADTNLQVIHNDGSGVATKVDLGASFPANRSAGTAMTTMYTVMLYNAPSSSSVTYLVINQETGVSATGTLSTNLPLSTQGLNIFASRCMGSPTSGTGQFDLTRLGCYSL